MKRYRTVASGNDFAVVDESGKVESRYPTQDQADIRLKALGYPEAWRKRIAEALPRRLQPSHRSALVTTLAEAIERWHSIRPEVEPYRKKLERLSKEVDRLQSVSQRASVSVSKVGGDVGRGRHSAEGNLNLIVVRAARDLSEWNRLWRPARARPRSFSVELVKRLQDEFRLYCGKTTRGFEKLLEEMRHPEVQRLLPHRKLPTTTSSAIQKRTKRKADKVSKK